ncbi:hypothetical protein F5X99DRAFT_388310 [Biscogniauxia marginata]|nr:hypothetical protein F5X99DRAFT_388310 [Biscogniauxia marginata]
MSQHGFRAIIVGGGPSGLTAAHALSQANIDFVVLERRKDIVEDVGASLVLQPGSLRVLSQLGLLNRTLAISTDFRKTGFKTLPNAYHYNTVDLYMSKENHGTYAKILHRAHLLEVLYGSFCDKDKARIFPGKKVVHIESDDLGVNVRCADGTSYQGSIVIGADGVNSNARQWMRSRSLESSPESSTNEANPFVSEYRALWFTFPRPATFELGEAFASHGTGVSIQVLNSTDRSWMFLYERLVKPTREKVYYTQREVNAFADKMGDLALDEKLRVKDIFATNRGAGMSNLEEGILKHWSWGRIVLVGDSAHKFTPNQGLGYNNGIQDVVVLTNEIQNLLQSGADPSVTALDGAFKRYQADRLGPVSNDFHLSAIVTRYSAWGNVIYWVLDRYIMRFLPFLQQLLVNHAAGGPISQSRVLDFVQGVEPYSGKIPWVFPMKCPPIH